MISDHSAAVGAGIGHDCDPQTRMSHSKSFAKSEVLISRSGTPSKSGDASHGGCIMNSSIPLLRPFGCAPDGEGGPALAQAKRRALGRAMPQINLHINKGRAA